MSSTTPSATRKSARLTRLQVEKRQAVFNRLRLGDLRHRHALSGQQHHLGPTPGHNRHRAAADEPRQPPALIVTDLSHLHSLGHDWGLSSRGPTLGTVTYDIIFAGRRPGRTLLETLEDRAAEHDPDAESAPVLLTAAQRAAWERILQRVTAEVGPVTSQEYLYSLTLWRDGSAGRLQMDYVGDSADIEIPYGYPGKAALPIIAEAYRVAHIVEEATGLEGFDGQTEQPIAVGDIEAAAAKLAGIARWAQDNLT